MKVCIYVLLLSINSMLVTSCTNIGNKKNEPIVCFEQTYSDLNVEFTPIITGIERENPVNIIAKDEFVDKLKASSLWSHTDSINSDDYEFSLSAADGFLQTQSSYDVNDLENIINITYVFLNVQQRSEYGHELLDKALTSYKLVIDALKTMHNDYSTLLTQGLSSDEAFNKVMSVDKPLF